MVRGRKNLMPFKLQNNRMIEVKHETVFGRLVEVSGLSEIKTCVLCLGAGSVWTIASGSRGD